MQLNDLKTHPVIRSMAYVGFFFIIISFVFFYGWQQSNNQQVAENRAFARHRATDTLAFLPWRKWEFIPLSEVEQGRRIAVNSKLSLLDPALANFAGQQAQVTNALATTDEAIERAMDMRLLRLQAANTGIIVDEEELKDRLREMRDLDLARFEQEVNNTPGGVRGLLASMKQEQEATRAVTFIAGEARASLYELWLEYLLVNEEITLNVARFPALQYEDKVTIEEAELQAYLDENAEALRLPPQRKYGYVKLTLADISEGLDPSEEQLKTYYEQNQASYLTPEAVRVVQAFSTTSDLATTVTVALGAAVIEKVGEGLSLEDAVYAARDENEEGRIYYTEPGWITRDESSRTEFGDAVLDTVFALADDEISSPTTGPRGVHIVQRLESREAGPRPFEEVRDEIDLAWRAEQGATKFAEEISRLKSEVSRFESIRDFALSVGLEDGMTELIDANTSNIKGVGDLTIHARYIRSLKVHRLSEIIPVPAENPTFVVALQIMQATESRAAELSDVRDDVLAEVRSIKARQLASEAAEAARGGMDTGMDFATAVADAPTTSTLTDPFKRGTSRAAIGVNLIGFAQQSSRIRSGMTGLSAFGESEAEPEGYALWKVEEIKQPTREEFTAERRSFEAQYLRLKRQILIEEWLADKRRDAEFVPMTDLNEGRG